MSWELAYSKRALKDAKKPKAVGLKPRAEERLAVLQTDPSQSPPPFDKLVADLAGAYGRRIHIHNGFVYEVLRRKKTVRVLRMWTRRIGGQKVTGPAGQNLGGQNGKNSRLAY